MTITYHAGRRLQGLASDLTATGLPAGSVGGWVELARTTLGAGADQLDVSSLPDKRYYMYLHWVIPDTYVAPRLRLGNSSVDTGSNYSRRMNENGGTDVTATSQDHITGSVEGGGNDQLIVGYIANRSANAKLNMSWSGHRKNAGAANAPGRGEIVGKWTNTSNPLDVIRMYNGDTGAGDYASGSELVVLGWDPADTHTTNFWQELASVNASGDTLDTGTFTAKKYLWVQCYIDTSGGNVNNLLRFNGDTSGTYASRQSSNGGTDGTSINQSFIDWGQTTLLSGFTRFYNAFIINNASNEKLMISHKIDSNTAGAANAPDRLEIVGKWANTSNQITRISANNTSGGDFGSNTILKVWGAD